MKRLFAALSLSLLALASHADVIADSGASSGATASTAPVTLQNANYFAAPGAFTGGLLATSTYAHGLPVASPGTILQAGGSPISCYKPGQSFGVQGKDFGITAAIASLFGSGDDDLCDIGRAKNIVVDIESLPVESLAKRVVKNLACTSALIANAYEDSAEPCVDLKVRKSRKEDSPAAKRAALAQARYEAAHPIEAQ